MSDLKEREQLKSKAIEDIDFLKSKEIDIRTILRSYFSDIQVFAPIDAALSTITMNSTDYLDTGNIESLRNFYANFLNRFTNIRKLKNFMKNLIISVLWLKHL